MDKYRCVLEVLRFAGAWEALHATSLSRVWASASNAEELWRDLCECAALPYRPGKSAKEEYRDVPTLDTKWGVAAEAGTVWVIDTHKLLRKSVTADLSLKVDSRTRFCQVSAADFITCGPFSNACKLTLRLAICIYSLSSMRKSRSAPGLLKHRYNFYAFGGSSSEKLRKSIEKYSIPDDKWELVGRMNEARVDFQPCVYRTEVYLIGCAMPAELFSTVTCQCKYLQFVMPMWTVWTLSVYRDREMSIITGDLLFRAKFAGTVSVLHSREIREVGNIESENVIVRVEVTKKELRLVKYDWENSQRTVISVEKAESVKWE